MPRRSCSIDGCGRPHAARGLCSKHYQRAHRDLGYQRRWRARNVERRRAYQRRWYAENREKERLRARDAKIREKYGLSRADYEAIIARGCEICGSHERICLDHDHETGAIRGPLCDLCNRAIGLLGDEADRARSAGEYLDRHRAPKSDPAP